MSTKTDPFKSVTVRSYTAKRFLEKLDETHECWGGKPMDWIFRGQNDAKWELMPSLFRPKNWGKDTPANYEIDLIYNFIRNVNLKNLPIPNNSLDYIIHNERNTKRGLGNKELSYVVYDFSHVIFAIAQHSGVPTRLLDFTYNPLVAAYFAADVTQLFDRLELSGGYKAKYFDDCLEKISETDAVTETLTKTLYDHMLKIIERIKKLPKHIAVWAIRYDDLRETTIRLLEQPYTEILNLRLQMGVFLCEAKYYKTEGNSWRSFDAELAKLVEKEGIYKFTLPFSQRIELLDLLAKKRISSSDLTPTYEKVAKEVLEITKELNKKKQ